MAKYSASSGGISVIAGNYYYGYTGNNGAATSATLKAPEGIGVDAAGE